MQGDGLSLSNYSRREFFTGLSRVGVNEIKVHKYYVSILSLEKLTVRNLKRAICSRF